MANGDNLFSKVFRGFAPDEVIAYIDELNAAHRSARAESDARINSLTDELGVCEKSREENEALKALVSEKDGVIAEKNGQIERLTADTENQRLAMVAQTEKINELEETVIKLKSELEAASIKNAAMEQNSREYENMLADVDSILASARRKAEELIDDSEKKAAQIVEASEKQAALIVENAEKEAKLKTDRIISESDEHLNENMKKVKYLYRRQDELAEIFKSHKEKVDSFFASIGDSSDKN